MEILRILTSLQVPVTPSKIEVRWHVLVKDSFLMVTWIFWTVTFGRVEAAVQRAVGLLGWGIGSAGIVSMPAPLCSPPTLVPLVPCFCVICMSLHLFIIRLVSGKKLLASLACPPLPPSPPSPFSCVRTENPVFRSWHVSVSGSHVLSLCP